MHAIPKSWRESKKKNDAISFIVKLLCACNRTRTHNHLVHKRTLNHLAELSK